MRDQIADACGAIVILCLLVLPVGCVPAPAVPLDLQPWIAVTGHYSVVSMPKPAPANADACPTCGGKGWLGDGVTRLTCSACNGTGKATKSVLVVPAPPPATTILNCQDGKCTTRIIGR